MLSRLLPILALGCACLAFVPLSACSSGGGGTEDHRVAGVIHRLLLAAGTQGTELLESYPGRLPDDLPAEPPLYPGAEILVSNRQPAPNTDFQSSTTTTQSILYFIVLDTADSRSDVNAWYEEALDQEPWQLQSTFSTDLLDTIQFFDTADTDIGGVVSVTQGGEDNRTSVLISLQDTGASLENVLDYQLQPSLALPGTFPEDVPIFEGATITGTAFFREPTLHSYLVVFLTTAADTDVIDFYRETFQANGWTVQDTTALGQPGRIDFHDSAGDVQGDVSVNKFNLDAQYNEVTVQVQVNPAREAGTGTPEEGETPTPPATQQEAGTPTPAG